MPSKADIFCVPPEDIGKAWPIARSLIKAAIEHNDLSEFDLVERDILSGHQLLWLVVSDRIEAAVTTHLIKGNDRPVCVITACAGSERERWIELRKKIEAYAKAEGCKCVRLYGRRGWERVLKDYRVEHVIMEKAL